MFFLICVCYKKQVGVVVASASEEPGEGAVGEEGQVREPQLLATQEMASFSECALRMSRLSARLIGQVPRPTDSKGMKVAKL